MQLCNCETLDEKHLRIIEEWRSLIVGRGAVAELASRAGLLGDRCAKSTCMVPEIASSFTVAHYNERFIFTIQ